MARTIHIEVTGASQNYEAMVSRVTEANRRMTRDANNGAAQTGVNLKVLMSGLSAFQGLAAGAFSIGAIVAYTKHVVDLGGQLTDLAEKTGFSTQTLAGLRNVLEENGQNISSFARAVSIAQKNLGAIDEDGTKASTAMKALGLNVELMKRAKPEEFLKAFAEALAKVESHNQRAALAAAVMGKSGAEMAPIIAKLAADFEKLRKEGLSEDTIRALDDLGDAFTRNKNKLIDFTANALVKVMKELGQLPQTADEITRQLDATRRFAPGDKGKIDSLERQLLEARERQDQRELANAKPEFGDLIDLDADKKRKEAEEFDKKRLTALGKLNESILQTTLKIAELKSAESANTEEVRQATYAIIEREKANAELAAAQDKMLPQLQGLIDRHATLKREVADLTLKEKQRQDDLKRSADFNKFLLESENAEIAAKEKLRAEIEREFELKDKLLQLDVEKLQAAGLEAEADKLLLASRIRNNAERQKTLDLAAAEGRIFQVPGERATTDRNQAADDARLAAAKRGATAELNQLEIERLRIIGRTREAEEAAIVESIRLLHEKRAAMIEAAAAANITANTSVIDARINNEIARLEQLGKVSVDVGTHVGNTLNDIFGALITGTLKSVDIGKSAVATLGRIVTDAFQQTIKKKLVFELDLFNNLKKLPAQANSALQAGVAAVPNGGGGNGGIINTLFGGGGGGGAPSGGGNTGGGGFFSNLFGNIFGGGSTGSGTSSGGFFSGISNLFGGGGNTGGGGLFSNIFSGLSNLVGNFSGGSTGGGIMGFAQNLLGGFSDFVSGIWGAGASGGIAGLSNFFSGSVGAGASGFTSAWAAAANEGVGVGAGAFSGALNGIGGAFTAGILPLITAAFTDGFSKQNLGTTIGTSIGAAIGTYIFPGIGTVIGAVVGSLIGSLFNQKPNPTAVLKAKFSGVFYDALEGVFKPGDITTNVTRKADLKGSAAWGIAGMVQEALTAQADIWTGLLNMFPRNAREAIVPGLGAANENLNNAFGRLKFSEGGRRSIEQELRDLSGWEGGRGFFHAMRESIGTGFETVLRDAGLDNVAEAARDQFQRGVLERGGRQVGNVMLFPEDDENAQKFIQSIANLIGLTSQLGNVSPRGVRPFLTEADTAFLERGFGSVFNSNSDPLAFIKNAEALQEKIEPVMEYLKQAIGESTTLFGNGIIAALETAGGSTALQEFHRILGDGTRDLIFKGITEAALASARFNDLLAPIQQVIRDTTQRAIASGEQPDLSDFFDAVRPLLGDLADRADLLRPFIEALSELGRQFGVEFERFDRSSAGNTRIEINIERWESSSDPREFARFLEDEINGRTAPD